MTVKPETCPSKIQLDRFLMAELDRVTMEHLAEHCHTCTRCGAYLKRAKTEEQELRKRAEENQFVQRLTSRLSAGNTSREGHVRGLKWGKPRSRLVWALGASITACLIVVFTVYLQMSQTLPKRDDFHAPLTRIKGANMLKVFCLRGEHTFSLEPGILVQAGDSLRFEVFSVRSSQFLLLGLQDDGQIAVYLPFQGQTSMPLPLRKRRLLEGSIVLDDYPGNELLIAAFAKRRFKAASLMQAITKAFTKTQGNLLELKQLHVPQIEIETHLLRRGKTPKP